MAKPHRAPHDANDFEELCAEWMRWFGVRDARTTNAGPDGGVDIIGSDVVAQAKFHPSQKVTEPSIRDLIGCKTIQNKKEAWFFAYGPGYTPGAIELGTQGHVVLFSFDAPSLSFKGLTSRAKAICSGTEPSLKPAERRLMQTNVSWLKKGDEIRYRGTDVRVEQASRAPGGLISIWLKGGDHFNLPFGATVEVWIKSR